LRDDRIEEAVPKVPCRRLTSVPRHLDSEQFAALIASLDGSSPRGLRDKAIVLRTWMRGPDSSGHPGDGPATGADDDRMSVNINRGIRLHLWTPPRS
jgi:hypothetical protein